jgi:hypothetical protein
MHGIAAQRRVSKAQNICVCSIKLFLEKLKIQQ